MNILPINRIMPKIQFKGIMLDNGTEKTSNTRFDWAYEVDMGTDYITNKKEYFPFEGETDAEIQKAIKGQTKNKEWYNGLVNVFEKTVVEIKKTLPFTASEYKEFIKQNPMSNEELIKFVRLFELLTKK